MEISPAGLLPDITFNASRSGGKGGQNVNKVSSKVELNFDLAASPYFTEEQKSLIRTRLANRIIASGDIIQIVCQEERSQLLNKERCLEKLLVLLKGALHVNKPRKATKPRRSAIEQRLKEKQQQALKKLNRRKDIF